MRDATRTALVSRLSDCDRAVEIGVGRRDEVACKLVDRGVTVTITDIHPQPIASHLRFVRDDVTSPDLSVYQGADLLYALNLPPELHRPALSVASTVDAAFRFTTLGGDLPAIPATSETLPGETLYIADS